MTDFLLFGILVSIWIVACEIHYHLAESLDAFRRTRSSEKEDAEK